MIKRVVPGLLLCLSWASQVSAQATAVREGIVPDATARGDFEACLLQTLSDPGNDLLLVSQVKAACAEPGEVTAAADPFGEPGVVVEAVQPGESARSYAMPAGFREFFTPYKRNYILFGSMQNKDGGEPFSGKTLDIRYEIGMKFRLFQNQASPEGLSPLYFGYSQRSWWDIAESSAPFKEHNYNPELFWDFQDAGADQGWLPYEFATFVDRFGFEHQSNGRDGLESRSWDRLYAQKSLRLRDDLAVRLKAFVATNEGDNNADITDYLGNGEVQLTFEPNQDMDVILTSTKGHSRSKYNYQLDLVYTMGSWLNTKFMLSYYDGYGEALASYDEKTRSLRAGIYIPVIFEN